MFVWCVMEWSLHALNSNPKPYSGKQGAYKGEKESSIMCKDIPPNHRCKALTGVYINIYTSILI